MFGKSSKTEKYIFHDRPIEFIDNPERLVFFIKTNEKDSKIIEGRINVAILYSWGQTDDEEDQKAFLINVFGYDKRLGQIVYDKYTNNEYEKQEKAAEYPVVEITEADLEKHGMRIN